MAYSDYAPLFSGAEQKYGLPPGTLSGVGYVESRYNPRAVSPAGAQGLMQFMPATARGVGLSNPFDPSASIDAAGNLLSQNMKATGGNLRNALMMYNAGTNPSRWHPSYADSVLAHAQSLAPPPQSNGGQPPMPPQPASLGGLMQPQNLNAPQMQPAASLGGLASDPYGNNGLAGLPQGKIPQPSKFNAGNIMGVLGDALMAYGGMKPQFAPFMQEQQMAGQQRDFEREKFQQQLQMQMYAMLHPAEFMQAKAFQGMPGPDQRNYLKFLDATHPEYSMTPVGQVLNKRVTDAPSDAVAHLRGAIGAGADKASEIAKFNQIFGPGAAEEALGAQ